MVMRKELPGNGIGSVWCWCSSLVILLLTICLASCGQNEAPEPPADVVRQVKIFSVAGGGDSAMLRYPGSVRAKQRADVAFQVPGTLRELPVSEGQEVQKGQVLARLDQRDFETSLRNAQGQLARARAALESATSEYNRIVRIREQDPGAASESMVVRRREAMDQARAEVESALASVDAAQNQLGYTILHAPFNGRVSKRHVDNFQEVQAKQAIVSLDDISALEILVDLPESVFATLQGVAPEDDTQALAFAEFPVTPGRRHPLRVKEFSTRADPVTQTYQVVFAMERPEDVLILPGMTAIVYGRPLRGPHYGGRLDIPAIALFADTQGNPHVWVIDPESMAVFPRAVQTGDLVGDASIQVTAGLEPGEMIAVSGVGHLREGMEVRPFDGAY